MFNIHINCIKGITAAIISIFWQFQLLLILIDYFVTSIYKKLIYDENWACDMYLNVWVCDEFLSSQKWQKKWRFGLFRPNLPQLGLFHPSFVCQSNFRVISMIKMVVWDQNKPIWLCLKIQKSKNQKFVNCTFIIHKNGNKTSIQPILKSNSTSFMFNNIFSRRILKKLPTGGEGNGGTVLISSWKWITVFTWISKYITWISKQYPHFYAFYCFLTSNY